MRSVGIAFDELAAGIERFQAQLALAESEAVEEPPGHAVHRGDDGGVLAEQRRDARSDLGRFWPFTATNTQSCGPSLAGSLSALSLYAGFLSRTGSASPSSRMAVRCAPRATTETS